MKDVYEMLADALRERDMARNSAASARDILRSRVAGDRSPQTLQALKADTGTRGATAGVVATTASESDCVDGSDMTDTPTPPVAAGAGTLDDTGPDGMTDEEFAQTVQITREPLPDGMRQAAARLTEEAMAGTAPTGPHPEFPMMSEQPVPGTSGAPHEPPPTGRPDRPPAQIQHPTRPVHVPQS